MRDPYEVLGVGRTASDAEINAAYRKKALLLHPDRNPGDRRSEEQFKEATRAYEVLKDPAKKLAHDLKSEERESPFPSAGDGPFPGPGSPDFFNNVWGIGFENRGPVNRARRSGNDIESEVILSVEEAVLGTTKNIMSLTGEEVPCGRCSGTRAEPGTRRILCTRCMGSGKNFPTHTAGTGKCRACNGYGETPSRRCTGCIGVGRVKSSREIALKVPAGISDGQRLRLAGQGEPGIDGPPGDMFVTVRVAEGGRFSRRGNDLHTVLTVSFHEALGHLGSDRSPITVKGIDGKEHMLDLSGDFRPGETQFVIRGAGVGGMDGARGNLYVVVQVGLPEVRTPRAAALVRELVDELAGRRPQRQASTTVSARPRASERCCSVPPSGTEKVQHMGKSGPPRFVLRRVVHFAGSDMAHWRISAHIGEAMARRHPAGGVRRKGSRDSGRPFLASSIAARGAFVHLDRTASARCTTIGSVRDGTDSGSSSATVMSSPVLRWRRYSTGSIVRTLGRYPEMTTHSRSGHRQAVQHPPLFT